MTTILGKKYFVPRFLIEICLCICLSIIICCSITVYDLIGTQQTDLIIQYVTSSICLVIACNTAVVYFEKYARKQNDYYVHQQFINIMVDSGAMTVDSDISLARKD